MRPLSSAAARLARTYPSYRDFVDDALFDPAWGYYSTGVVRFGEGGHYDTFPTALSPLFGRMVARAAFRFWERIRRPSRLEVCEIGGGNGQLCLDTVVAVETATRTAAWNRFASAFRYRIVERSRALASRQRAKLGPLAARVTWTRADLSRRMAAGAPFGEAGFVVANEVLDCLAHHKIVPGPAGETRVVFVVPARRDGRPVTRRGLARSLGATRPARLRYREVALPLDAVSGLRAFLARYCPERLVARRPFPPYFACPEMPTLVRNVARLYDTAEMLWIDYGDIRPFHRRAPERHRVFAGPPRSARSVYDAPGRDDITFMVDFSVVAEAARDAGLAVTFYGDQGVLARVAGVHLGAREVDLIARARAASWMLDVVGIGPEHEWRRGGITWTRDGARGGTLEAGIARDVLEFLGRRPSRFRMIALSTGPTVFRHRSRRGAVRRGRRTDC
ncbi:MAG: SAM-dependent methyltransferase [Candidatus Binatia bacterium]